MSTDEEINYKQLFYSLLTNIISSCDGFYAIHDVSNIVDDYLTDEIIGEILETDPELYYSEILQDKISILDAIKINQNVLFEYDLRNLTDNELKKIIKIVPNLAECAPDGIVEREIKNRIK